MYKVYLFEQSELVSEEFVARVLPLLLEERRRRVMRFRRLIDRKNCVIAFLMLKIALKQEFYISDFVLQYGEYGKPYLADYPSIHFNISHCNCGCAVAVADQPIGIDIQNIRGFCSLSWFMRSDSVWRDIAQRVCCKEELEILERSAERDREFTRMWAMKESYVKMLGRGIGDDLTKINTVSMKAVRVIDRASSVISVCDCYEK